VLTANLPPVPEGIVLVIDDQEPALRLYQRFASRTSFQVIGTTDPVQALNLARQLHPVLITLDVMMPHSDGWEVLQSLQLDPETKGIPVVICSAWEEPELARSLGAAGFLKKPVTQRDFLALLEKHTKSRVQSGQ
jgi:CheY-like chemotaxis protein